MSLFRKDQQTVPCSVTQEFVDYVARLYPQQLLNNEGEPIIPRVLFLLGFYIDINKPTNEYYVVPNMIVRTVDRPYETYKTTVYNGRVRNEVKSWDGNKPVYDKFTHHFMKRIYEEVEVLNIGTVDIEDIININDIGSILEYNKGMAKMNEKVDPEKTFRQIVR